VAFDDPEAADRLDAFLDGLVRRRPLPDDGLDPGLAKAVRRFHALGAATASRPDASFIACLEADLMNPAHPTPVVPRPFAANGHQSTVRPPFPAAGRAERRRWPISEVMVAAVVLLALAVGLAANNRGGPPAVAPDDGGMRLGAMQPATPSAGSRSSAMGTSASSSPTAPGSLSTIARRRRGTNSSNAPPRPFRPATASRCRSSATSAACRTVASRR
jgi:hypothetical protein